MLTEDEINAINTTTSILSSVSFVGSTLIIFSYVLFPKLRKFSLQLVVWLSLSDIGGNISHMMGNPENGSSLCVTQALLKQFFKVATFTWTTVISYTLYQTVVRQLHFEKRSILWLHIYAWGLPFVLAIIPAAAKRYGNTGAWCWIEEDGGKDVGTLLRFLCFYIPLWLAITFNICAMFLVIREIKSVSASIQTDNSRKLLKLCSRLKLYPMIMVVCWTFATINRIQNSISPQSPVFMLFYLHVFFISLQGLMNSIAYGFTPSVRQCWRQFLTFNMDQSGNLEADNIQSTSSLSIVGNEFDDVQTKGIEMT